jgi:hypothetical protein
MSIRRLSIIVLHRWLVLRILSVSIIPTACLAVLTEEKIMRLILLAITALSFSPFTLADDYCANHYDAQIANVNSELGGLVKRESVIDARVASIFLDISKLSTQLATVASRSPPDVPTIQLLGRKISDLNAEKTALQNEGYKDLDRITALKGAIPAQLQGELRGCVEATAPTNNLVNLTIQALAILSTGGASLLLPPKALYVDMSAVLNGYPTGGPNSVINQARESALQAVGLGGHGNSGGNFIRNPGCVFHGGC